MADKTSFNKLKSLFMIGLGLIFIFASIVSLIAFPASFWCYVFLALGGSLVSFGVVEYQKTKVHAAARKLRSGSDHVNVYEKPDHESPLVVELNEGDEINLGDIKEVDGFSWIQVVLPDGRRGYAFAELQVYKVLTARTISPDVIVYKEPNLNSDQIELLKTGSVLDISEEHWARRYVDSPWIMVWLPDGRSGYTQSIKVKWESNLFGK